MTAKAGGVGLETIIDLMLAQSNDVICDQMT